MNNSGVKKRDTFYLAGYDPRGTRYYYNLYKKEVHRSSKINGIDFDISSRKKETAHIISCAIEANSTQNKEKLQTQTQYYFLEWDDIIRKTWSPSILIFIKQFFIYLQTYVFSKFIVKIYKVYLRQLKPMLYPAFYVLMIVILVYFLAKNMYALLASYIPAFLSLGIVLFFAFLLIRFSQFLGRKIAVFWILRIYIFSEEYAHKERKDIEKRLQHFASFIVSRIEQSKEEEIDEFLIVSHSVGTILIIPLLAEILKNISPKNLEKITVMSLGSCVPLVSFLEDVSDYKKHMQTLTQYDFLWLDISSPSDEICSPLMDYYAYSGVSKPQNKGPLLLSPRFHTLYEHSTYVKLQKDLSLMHFLYLMAPQKEGSYDYFNITAGHTRFFHAKHKENK